MKRATWTSKQRIWQWLVALALLLGILFRGYGLGDRVYWVDEVATSVRIAGYTRAEVTAQLSDGVPRTPADLQQFLHPAPDLPLTQVLRALVQSPEHAPLYFLLAHGWTKLWGSSIVAVRSLSVLFSLISLALIGRLASQLFNSAPAGAIATTLLALSPFFVSYAQEARPYSLWSVTLLWSSLALWNAMGYATENVKQNVFGNEMPHSLWRWLPYGFSMAVGLYTSLLTALVLLGHGLYVLWVGNRAQRHGFLQAAALAVGLFLPWILIVLSQWDTLQANTEWMRQPMGALSMLVVWLYSLVVLFFDAPVELGPVALVAAKFLTALLTLGAIAFALWWTLRQPRVGSFVAALLLPVPVILVALDLIRQGQASATSRYLIPVQLAVLIAIAGWLSVGRSWQRGVLAFLLMVSFLSGLSNLHHIPDYQKSRNRHNPEIAARVNQQPSPQIIAESRYALDLVSLSQFLKPDTRVQILSPASMPPQRCEPFFLLNPPALLQQDIQQRDRPQITEVFRPKTLTDSDIYLSLWHVENPDRSCPSS
ncbi:glycosyltransferase family 39 protein [Thermoleptolyngbya sp. C42_A2020_037]|uniref:glycosyltransferase family 39 protein n=1 Tax=Thermoleptolyngbya sp. C42_A2020_037 TaxID=2747799 RepID=UPI001A0348AD|nr:glycosyltransferase family 39 protein [Thermoleptolyngbya sp. C42_A2020_037]MBF2084362.1 glycosyltransferase family 39 protein [Thermoleptolyngbya sp. C42_A2020_037]